MSVKMDVMRLAHRTRVKLDVTRDDFVHINICGHTYQVLKSTLDRFPCTMLGDEKRRKEHYVDFLNAYYFDEDRRLFESILYYYQSGGFLIRPCNISMETYSEKVRFYGLSEKVLRNMQHMEGYVPPENVVDEVPDLHWKRKVWLITEHPETSLLARLFGGIMILIILLSIVTFCMDTLPQFDHHPGESESHAHCQQGNSTQRAGNSSCVEEKVKFVGVPITKKFISIVESGSTICFTIEYIIRFIVSPQKWKFLKSFLNLIDLGAILPFYIMLAVNMTGPGAGFGVVRVARIFRVLRVLKLSRHSMGLQVLGNTLKASMRELLMIFFTMSCSIIIFSSAMYYAEMDYNENARDTGEQTTFESIPDAFWYSLVTMTTVGYGDYFPLSIPGRLVGGLCAISGVLMVAMVVPVVVANFEFYYKRDKMISVRKKERTLSMAKELET